MERCNIKGPVSFPLRMRKNGEAENDRSPLHGYLEEWRRTDGLIRLTYSNLAIKTRPEMVPYVHVSDKQPASRGVYSITSSSFDLDGVTVIEYTYSPSNSPSLVYFMAAIAEILALRKVTDPYSPSPLQSLEDKVRTFLQTHTSMNYAEFAAGFDVDDIAVNDYGLLGKAGLKRKLFDFRAKTFLAALAATEERGFDLQHVLQEVSDAKIIPLKKERDEPTFTYIFGRLKAP